MEGIFLSHFATEREDIFYCDCRAMFDDNLRHEVLSSDWSCREWVGEWKLCIRYYWSWLLLVLYCYRYHILYIFSHSSHYSFYYWIKSRLSTKKIPHAIKKFIYSFVIEKFFSFFFSSITKLNNFSFRWQYFFSSDEYLHRLKLGMAQRNKFHKRKTE